jgi:hypothetical protein
LNNIDNENFLKILEKKGPKYHHEPQSTNWKYNFKLLRDSLEDNARKRATQEKEIGG